MFDFYPSFPIIVRGLRVCNYHQNSGFLTEIKHLVGSCYVCRFMTQHRFRLFGKDIIYYSVIWNSSPYFPGPLTSSPPIDMCCAIPEILKTILHGIKKSHQQPGRALAFQKPGTVFGVVITEPKKALWTHNAGPKHLCNGKSNLQRTECSED